MKKILCVPDSFKGSLSSREVGMIMRQAVLDVDPTIEVVAIDVADGGEGTVDAFLSVLGGTRVEVLVPGPEFTPIPATFGILPDGTAIIEMAAAAGLPLVANRRNPEIMTTLGVGQLITAALDHGATKIILGLGGSCTNDGGCGAASALGVRFLDRTGQAFIPTGGTLLEIATLDVQGLDPRLAKTRLEVMCDIDHPMHGPHGAAYVFGPQKGADPAMVRRLDQGLVHLATLIQSQLGKDVSHIPGGGAAGAMGAGVVAFLGGTLKMGIETVLDAVHFDEQLVGADLVLTGEGRFDTQSLRGKVPIGVARRAQNAGVPVIVFAGNIGESIDAAYDMGVTALYGINPHPVDLDTALKHARENLAACVNAVIQEYNQSKSERCGTINP